MALCGFVMQALLCLLCGVWPCPPTRQPRRRLAAWWPGATTGTFCLCRNRRDPLKLTSQLKNDFNGDFVSDLLWRSTSSGNFTVGFMRQSTGAVGTSGLAQWGNSVSVGLGVAVAGSSDFNIDGKTDIVFRNTATGNTVIGYMGNPGGPVWATIDPAIATNVVVQGVGDFTGDGKADILWRNTVTGNAVIARMNGHVVVEWVTIGVLPLDVQPQSP
jgi:hypothetical protein